MQIVDASELGIRVVVLTLKRCESPLTFVLFPMIHVGSPQFYESIRKQVAECDLAVVEGVGKSVPSSLLTLTYRVVRFSRRSGLMVQNLGPNSFDIPVINPDMTGSKVRLGWRRVPWLHRMMIWCMVPVMLVVGPRRFLTCEHGRQAARSTRNRPGGKQVARWFSQGSATVGGVLEYARHGRSIGGGSPLEEEVVLTPSRRQLRRREAGWEGSPRRNPAPRNTNRVEGGAIWVSLLKKVKPVTINRVVA